MSQATKFPGMSCATSQQGQTPRLPSIREVFPGYFSEPEIHDASHSEPPPSNFSCQEQVSSLTQGDDPKKRYSCEVCDKRFQRPSSLRNHMTSHTGERPHECPFPGCHKRFSTKSNMKRHAVIHSSDSDAHLRAGAPNEHDDQPRSHGPLHADMPVAKPGCVAHDAVEAP